jgi:hypothetical protein
MLQHVNQARCAGGCHALFHQSLRKRRTKTKGHAEPLPVLAMRHTGTPRDEEYEEKPSVEGRVNFVAA